MVPGWLWCACSDACVATGKPLVSAAAVGTDGQLTVYNYGQDGKLATPPALILYMMGPSVQLLCINTRELSGIRGLGQRAAATCNA